MSPSIASSKSICLTLALAVLTSSSAASSSMCETCSSTSTDSSSFDITSSIINKRPIHLPPLSTTTNDDIDSSSISHQSNTTFDDEYNNDLSNLPEELIAMIQAQQQPSPASAPTLYPSKGVRFYATYGSTSSESSSSCTSKTVENFESWEESFGSLDECCSLLFSYDYDGCMMS